MPLHSKFTRISIYIKNFHHSIKLYFKKMAKYFFFAVLEVNYTRTKKCYKTTLNAAFPSCTSLNYLLSGIDALNVCVKKTATSSYFVAYYISMHLKLLNQSCYKMCI